MEEKRKSTRKTTDLDIEFKVTEVKFRQSTRILSRGKIVNISNHGFALTTHYPLEKGQVITINSDEHDNVPKFGLVHWTEHCDGVCRAGFGYKFNNET